jgi:hypothetical protein
MSLHLIGHPIGVTVLGRRTESSGGDELDQSRRAAPGQLYHGSAYLFYLFSRLRTEGKLARSVCGRKRAPVYCSM